MGFYLAMDTETGGLSPDTADVLTLYVAVVDENFKVLDELDLKLKPDDGRLPLTDAGALKVNGINIHQHLEDPETIMYSEAKIKLVGMIKKYLQKSGRYSNIRPMIYNASFDIGFIQRYVLPFKEWDSMISYNVVDPKIVVTFLKDCKWLPYDLGSLVSVVKHFQIPMGTAHTAKADTIAMIDVYKKILDIMDSKRNSGQAQDIISLLEAE